MQKEETDKISLLRYSNGNTHLAPTFSLGKLFSLIINRSEDMIKLYLTSIR